MILAVQTGSMTHSQESRVSSTQDNFRLSESRSNLSSVLSLLNSSDLGGDIAANVKLRGNPTKTKEQKMQDPFSWMSGFCNLCQATVGSRNVKHLENLINIYLENVTPNVKDCYTRPNRAAKLKKSMNDTLIFFHLFYQEIKEALEHSSYLDKMTPLVSMFMDMEIKSSLRGKDSYEKVASRLTSSLYIFLDNSEEHMLDAILMTKYVCKNYHEICHHLLRKLLNNISTYPMYEMLYVRCLLTFKLWKKIVPDKEEKKRINKTAIQKLHAPPNLMENIKSMGNVLPRIPKTKKNITLFLMQSKFNLKNACQEFLKSVKISQKTVYSQGLGSVEVDKPLFFINHSGNTSPRLTEKEDESDSGSSNNLIDDIWSSISTVKSNVSQTKRLKELSNDKAVAVESPEVPLKKKKLGKKIKKGKKKMKVRSGTKFKKDKKSQLKSSESTGTEKEEKKSSKLKLKKKKKKKLRQIDESIQSNIKQEVIPQVDECNQVKAKQALSQVEECQQVVAKPASPHLNEECSQAQVKQTVVQIEECDQVNLKVDLPLIEESHLLKVKQALPQVEECKDSKMKQTSPQVEECDQSKVELYDQINFKQVLLLVGELNQIKMEGPKIESELDIPKTEKLDGSLSSGQQIQDAEVSSKVEEPLVKKEKVECINMCVDVQFDSKKNVASEIMEQVSTVSCISSEKVESTLAEYSKPSVLSDESVTPSDDLATKSECKDKSEIEFDNSRSDLFTGKDISKKEVKTGITKHLLVEEGKVADYCHKPKIAENTVSVNTVAMEICDSSMIQEVRNNSGEMETSDVNKSVQIETNSKVDILGELQETGKCDISASDDEIVPDNDGDLLPRQAALNNTFDTENGDVVYEAFNSSERQYSMCRDVLTGESMVLETENPPVSDELEPGPSNMADLENITVNSYYVKTMKDVNFGLYDPSILEEEWIHYDNTCTQHLEFGRLPQILMEGEEEEEEVWENDLSKSFESTTPKRGMGKMSYEAVMSFNIQKELCASTSGRHSSQLCPNSSESGSTTTEMNSFLTSSASGSSSPHSESANDSVEGICQENMESCDNSIKSAELSVSSERIPDASNSRYYNSSNYQKGPETVSREKESFNAQSTYTSKVGDCRLDNARVVVETMDHYLVNRASSNRLTVASSTPETSFHKNAGGTGMPQSPLKRKKSSGKLVPERTECSQNASVKQGAGEFSMVQSRASVRGQRRRGRPPNRGRGVSSTCKLSSDTKSTRKQGYNGKIMSDPEYQATQSKKIQLFDDYPLTRSASRRVGINKTENMFEYLK